MTFDLELSDCRALVTAGTKGVGAAVVEVLSENGAKVVTTARSIPRDPLGSVHYIAADITLGRPAKPREVAELVAFVVSPRAGPSPAPSTSSMAGRSPLHDVASMSGHRGETSQIGRIRGTLAPELLTECHA